MEDWGIVQHALDLRASIHQSVRPGRVITDMIAAGLIAKANTLVELAREHKEEIRVMTDEIIDLREQIAVVPVIKVAIGQSRRPQLRLVSDNTDGGPSA